MEPTGRKYQGGELISAGVYGTSKVSEAQVLAHSVSFPDAGLM